MAGAPGRRGMFRQAGGVIGIAGVVLALSFYSDPGEGLAQIFVALAGVMLLTIPLAFLIPDTAWERRKARREIREAVAHEASPPRQRPEPTHAGAGRTARPIISGGADHWPAGD